MGLIDKFKNLFTEEVEVEEPEKEKKEGVQKEVIQVEIPSPKKARSDRYEEISVEEKKEEIIEEPKKSEYKFPFFDDNDFDTIDVKPEPKPEKKSRTGKKEIYNPPKEEKRVFRPSPIISPVYGILDKGYQKEEYNSKSEGRSSYYSSKEANVDAIRNKAYGGLEADIETTLFGGSRVLFSDNEKQEKEKNENRKALKNDFDIKIDQEKPRHGKDKDDDLTDLLEEEMDKPVEEEQTKKAPRKISDKELFSMIDSLYEKGNK